MNRRDLMTAGLGLAVAGCAAPSVLASTRKSFPDGFVWGASTSGHQVEGNDTASDTWFLANIQPTIFTEPVGDAANSFHLWPQDLDLCAAMGLGAYRFSIEWSRIEPVRGQVSQAMLDHYSRMIDGCHERGLKPVCTYNHFTNPRWFAADGGWLGADSDKLFADYAVRLTREFGDRIDTVVTLNEPNLPRLLSTLNLPPQLIAGERAMLARAAELTGGERFVATNVVPPELFDPMEVGMLKGHNAARSAIKAERGDLPVGVSLAIFDDQAIAGGEGQRDQRREFLYGAWLRNCRSDDYIGVQNYERVVWGPDGRLPAPEGAARNFMGSEIYAPSLAGAVRYAHEATGRPVLVTEHGVGTNDDVVRAAFIPEALRGLHDAMSDGVPVLGYCHWSLLDNFEWIFGYGPKFGLHSVDRKTFERTAKASAGVYSAIVKANAV